MATKYYIRQGGFSDLKATGSIYEQTIGRSSLFEILFPGHQVEPEPFTKWVRRLFWKRYWSLGYSLKVLVATDENDGSGKRQAQASEKLVGFTWWVRPVESMSFYERWISPCK